MDERALEIYKRYIPDLTQTENGYLIGCCPLCGGKESFLAGSVLAETGEPTDDFFICYLCGKEGTLKDFLETIGEDETEPEEAESPFRPETVDGLDFGKLFQQDQKIFAENEEEGPEKEGISPEISSDLKFPGEFLTLDLPGKELQIFILLHVNGGGLKAREISEKLKLSPSNTHRYLAALEGKKLLYSEGSPKVYFKIDDDRLIGRYCRELNTSKLK